MARRTATTRARPREPGARRSRVACGRGLSQDRRETIGASTKEDRGFNDVDNYAARASERTTAISLFGNAADTTNVNARAQALRQVAEDVDLYNAEFNRAFVLSEYIGYLRRVFEYHGAEHKTISCYEAGLPLTPANCQRFSRLHPRCGTSFLLLVMVVAIFVFAPIGLPAWYWLVLTRILGVPLIAGLSFELIKLAGRNRSRGWVRALMWPGLKLQLLTTREPDASQLQVAISALDAVLALETPGVLSADDLVGVEVVA